MKVLLTGATGFVGQALSLVLINEGLKVTALVRNKSSHLPASIVQVPIDGLSTNCDWGNLLSGSSVVIHLAARVHIMNDRCSNPLAEFRKVNTQGTLNLARQAAAAGVQRFIYLSSIKVNGEITKKDSPFVEGDTHHLPNDPYGLSKYEAEKGLREIARQTVMAVVIIRPPLVYGPGVKANFLSMMSWVHKGIPLPLGAISNQRSFLALDNLIDLIIICMKHPNAANQTFLASDDEDLSTTELLQRMAMALDKPSRLIPVHTGILILGATLLGKRDIVARLCGSLQVDINHVKSTLNWKPVVSVNEALQGTADSYLRQLIKS